MDVLADNLTNMFRVGVDYSALNYDVRAPADPSLSPELLIHADPLVNGPAVMRIGLGYKGPILRRSTSTSGPGLRYSTSADMGQRCEWTASLGTTLLLGLEYYRPLGKSRFFVAPRVNAGRATTNVVPAKDTLPELPPILGGSWHRSGYGSF